MPSPSTGEKQINESDLMTSEWRRGAAAGHGPLGKVMMRAGGTGWIRGRQNEKVLRVF